MNWALEPLPALEAKIASLNMSPGWLKREIPLLYREMKSQLLPAHWKYSEARKLMVQAANELAPTSRNAGIS